MPVWGLQQFVQPKWKLRFNYCSNPSIPRLSDLTRIKQQGTTSNSSPGCCHLSTKNSCLRETIHSFPFIPEIILAWILVPAAAISIAVTNVLRGLVCRSSSHVMISWWLHVALSNRHATGSKTLELVLTASCTAVSRRLLFALIQW